MSLFKPVSHIVIDSTNAYTDMCYLGKVCGTDKSPYGESNATMHRHPYTAVYAMLFAPLRNKHIHFAEIGVAGGNSALMWLNYFRNANLYFFDRDADFLNNVKQFKIPGRDPYTGLMDVSVDGDVKIALELANKDAQYDVILDDSSHEYEHQIRIIKESFPYIKPGGYMIVEDIYRTASESKYEDDLKDVIAQCALTYFVVCNHEERYSPGWNNDKLFILVKK